MQLSPNAMPSSEATTVTVTGWHCSPLHAPPRQSCPHAPQLVVALRSASQPSSFAGFAGVEQLAKFAAQVGLQTPSTQARAVVPVALHTTPHPPQLLGSSVRVVSQASAAFPLQSAVPLAHAVVPASPPDAADSIEPPSGSGVPPLPFAEVPPLPFCDVPVPSLRVPPSLDGFPPVDSVVWLPPPVSVGTGVAVAAPLPALIEPPAPPEPFATASPGAVHVAVSWQSGASAEQAVNSASNAKDAANVPKRYLRGCCDDDDEEEEEVVMGVSLSGSRRM